ncbi:Tub family protein [Nitzschia inconspicua]|uniref:Tub family protein n=1 Tax=Nitzschia inconspicua TaxID=303405 RepID=A0A9K3PJQ6_9STRA|nr:Tub family protein [Nitzschia inconspicua]
MIRNFNRSESTKRALSDVRQMSWRSYRSATSFSTSNGPTTEAARQTIHKSNSKQSQGTVIVHHDSSATRLSIEASLVPSKGSSFRVETVVRRTGSTYTMDLQLPKKKISLFVAELHGQTYVFKSAPQDQPGNIVMGTVCKKPASQNSNKKTTLTYALTHHEPSKKPVKVAYIDYEHPPLFQVLKDSKSRPRRCQVKVVGHNVVKTKEPHGSDEGHRSLDFKGRGREASIKNMQLEDEYGNVVLQMVKWDKDVFHVDFSPPFDAFHAFGFALAQFDM